ncbi:MAG: PAS domain S-box protein, partial [Chthoniobacteraceae bacterium]
MPGSRSALIIERAPLPIVEVQGSAHTVSHVNSAFCRLLGKSKEDLIGKSFADLVHGGDKCVPILDRVYQTGEAATLAQADEFDSASWLYAMWPALDANEQPEAVLIQLAKTANLRQDTAAVNEALLIAGLHQHELTESAEKLNVQLLEEITGRKQGDAARAILATIVESSDDAILSKDLNGTIATWNRGAERLFGYSAEEAIGQPITMLFPPDKLEEEAAILEGIRSGHPVKPYETVRRRKDGTLVDVSLTVSPIADARGQIVGASKIVRDITERKRAQVALRASEERFRVAALAMSNIIWTNNPQGMMEGEQPGWAHFTGQTREEYQGYGWARAVHPDDAQPTIEAWNAAVAEKRLFEFEHRVRRHDGAWCSCSVRAMPVIGDDGEIREWVGVHNDITERKQAADTILRSEENYRLLVEGATGFAIIRLQLDGTVSSWNVGAERILGYRDAEILGAHFSTFFTPEDLAAGKPERELRAAGDLEKGDDDNWLVRKDGSRFWASGATTALRDDAGNLRGFAKIVRDMSNHRAATDQLRALEARKSAILDGALDGIITMDHEGKVVDFNPAAEAMFGIAHAEIVGQGMADRIIPERLRESHYRGMAHYLKSGEGPVLSKRIEVPAQHADGHEFTIELSINRIAGIEPPMFTATLRDITERQRAEEALRASAEFNRKIIESSRDCVK